MPRPSFEENLSTGIFSPTNVARICNVSAPTVHKWLAKGLLAGEKIAGTREWRISAVALKRFLLSRNATVPAQIETAAAKFLEEYNEDFTLREFSSGEIQDQEEPFPSTEG